MMFCSKNIFISHSSENRDIAEQLCAFFTRIGVAEKRIFCSSVIGQGVGNGEKLNEAIGSAIGRSALLIYVLSYDFLQSPYCMEELGVGWYLAQKKKAKCFYLVLPDIDLWELRGFVNSKIDKFSFIDAEHRDELGLFAVDVAKGLKLRKPEHQTIVNASKTFFSASEPLLTALRKKREEQKAQEEEKKNRVKDLEDKNQEKDEAIDRLKKERSRTEEKNRREQRHAEYQAIINCFHILGLTGGISEEQYRAMGKNFWFIMVNRYEELEKEFGSEDANIQMLLANIYSASGNLDRAYERLKLYFKLDSSNIYPSFLANVKLDDSNDAHEITEILKEKLKTEPLGIVYDSYREMITYFSDRKKKLEETGGRD